MATKSKATAKGKIPAKEDAAKQLKDLFEDGLKDIYWAEKALTKALPKMEKNASSPELKKAIMDHLSETRVHIDRLKACFAELGKKAVAKKCEAMDGLIKEGESVMEDTKPGAVRDAGIIGASQKVEHYEIASYGTMAAFAKVLNLKKSLKNLLKTMDEEKLCDQRLSSIADVALNTQAMRQR